MSFEHIYMIVSELVGIGVIFYLWYKGIDIQIVGALIFSAIFSPFVLPLLVIIALLGLTIPGRKQ